MNNSNPNRIGKLKFWAWQSRGISTAINFLIMSWLMFYATDTLVMPAALVGTLLMASRIVDAFFDLPAGLIIDRTNTRFGKARPYEFAVIGMWLTTWLLFSIPGGASLTIQAIWLVIFYTLTSSIFGTALNAGNNVYMIRAFGTDGQRVRLTSFGGFVNMIFAMVVSISLPLLVSNFATSPASWSMLVLMFAIPMSIIGIMRFVFVKETEQVIETSKERANFKDVWSVLKANKFLRVVAVLSFVSTAASSLGASQFFFEWIMGDVGSMWIMGVMGFAAMPMVIFFPKILKKFTKGQLVIFGSIQNVVAGLIMFTAGLNITMPVIIISGLFSAFAALPIIILADLILLDVGTYNAYKSGKRMDGTLGSIRNFLGLVGGAVAPGLLGIMLGLSGYDGNLYVQPDSAIFMIRAAMGLFPAIMFAIVAVVFILFYKLDKQLPEINEALVSQKVDNDEE